MTEEILNMEWENGIWLVVKKFPLYKKKKLKLWDIRKWIVIEQILNMEWENGIWLGVEIYHLVLHMGMGSLWKVFLVSRQYRTQIKIPA